MGPNYFFLSICRTAQKGVTGPRPVFVEKIVYENGWIFWHGLFCINQAMI